MADYIARSARSQSQRAGPIRGTARSNARHASSRNDQIMEMTVVVIHGATQKGPGRAQPAMACQIERATPSASWMP